MDDMFIFEVAACVQTPLGVWEERTTSASSPGQQAAGEHQRQAPDMEPLGSTSGARWAQNGTSRAEPGERTGQWCLTAPVAEPRRAMVPAHRSPNERKRGASLHRSPNRARTFKTDRSKINLSPWTELPPSPQHCRPPAQTRGEGKTSSRSLHGRDCQGRREAQVHQNPPHLHHHRRHGNHHHLHRQPGVMTDRQASSHSQRKWANCRR